MKSSHQTREKGIHLGNKVEDKIKTKLEEHSYLIVIIQHSCSCYSFKEDESNISSALLNTRITELIALSFPTTKGLTLSFFSISSLLPK